VKTETVPFRSRHLLSAGRKSSLLWLALRGLDLSSISRRSQVPSATIHSVLLYSESLLTYRQAQKIPIVDMLSVCSTIYKGAQKSVFSECLLLFPTKD
jgi:hypothetical protein